MPAVVRIGGLAVSTTADPNNCLQLYATQPANEVIAVTWEKTAGNTSDYIKWSCFDAVPRPKQMSAMNMSNHMPEILVSTAGGNLFMNRASMLYSGERPWASVGLPELSSRIEDVCNLGVSGAPDRLYVAERGRVWGREKVNTDPYAPYGPWQSFGEIDVRRITAGIRLDGIVQVFAATSTGLLRTLVAPNHAAGAPPEQWTLLDMQEPIIDRDCSNSTDGFLSLYVLGTSGALYRRLHVFEDNWGSWQGVKSAETPPVLVVLAVCRIPATGPAVFGLDSNGVVQARNPSGQWQVVP